VNGSVLYAWDPVARKEKWRAAGGGAGPFAGGSISTAGNLVFSSVNNNLRAFNATTGQCILDFNLYMNQMGPPISVLLDGKQYIIVTGAPAAAGGGRGGGGGGGRGGGGGAAPCAGAATGVSGQAPAAPAATPTGPRPAQLLMLALDAKEPIPGAPAN
jgi:outer membrane protein assembly factor BamB